MNRRRFLQFLFGSGATVIVAPRLILPAARSRSAATVFVPGLRIAKTAHVTREALQVLEQNLTFARQVNRSYFHETAFVFTVPPLGETINVRTPARFACGRFGAADD